MSDYEHEHDYENDYEHEHEHEHERSPVTRHRSTVTRQWKPSTIFSPAVTRTGRMLSEVGSGQVA